MLLCSEDGLVRPRNELTQMMVEEISVGTLWRLRTFFLSTFTMTSKVGDAGLLTISRICPVFAGPV